LSRQKDRRSPGTRLTVTLDSEYVITADKARSYLEPYVRYIPVPVHINGELISQQSLQDRYLHRTKDFHSLGSSVVSQGDYRCQIEAFCDANAVASCQVADLTFAGKAVMGEVVLLQGSGQLMGLRNYFGLA